LVTGIWVGAEDRSVHFKTTRMGSGTNMALPIWAEYMKKVYADDELGITQEDIFDEPPGFDVNLNCQDEATDDYDDGIGFKGDDIF
jgi:penicillin-binding protein 1A